MLSPKRARAPPAPETPPMSPAPSTSQSRAAISFADLPNDCIIDILSFVGTPSSASSPLAAAAAPPAGEAFRDLGRALCAAPWLRELGAHAWAATVRRRWPAWAAIADAARVKRSVAGPMSMMGKAEETAWRRQAELFELREREELAVAPLAGGAIAKRQTVVQPRHRAVLAEWLAEVSWDWSCESTVIYRAVSYLDTYMASVGVEELGKYQLLGIAALRAAMADKAAATKAAAARKAVKEEVSAVVEGTKGEAGEPASKKQRRAAAAAEEDEDEQREESPEVVTAAEAEAEVGAASRESSPQAPVTPDVSGMDQEQEGDDDAEASTAETKTAAAEAAPTSDGAAGAEDKGDSELDPSRFSHISDAAYSPQDVVDATEQLVRALPARLRNGAPNAKMFLRSFWYRAVAGGALSSPEDAPPSSSGPAADSSSSEEGGSSITNGGDKMHVYTLASFFLQLSLLDVEGSEVAPSAAAAGALSLALEVFSPKAPSPPSASSASAAASSSLSCWPACLQRYSGISAPAVELQRERLRAVQASTAAPHLRAVWAARHEAHGYPEFSREWGVALGAMREAGEV